MLSLKLTASSSPLSPSERTKLDIVTQSSLSSDSFEALEHITILRLIAQAKFPVFLGYSTLQEQYLALKVFYFEDKRPHPYFENERRFSQLSHPNVIKFFSASEKTALRLNDKSGLVSCIIMEYAPYGDLATFVTKMGNNLDEKLARTLFRQLIEGIEYLHRHRIYHFDLKLGNLLIGEDYQLKIADFDLSFMKGDQAILTKGTRCCRAPEIKASQGDIGPAADVYSAGVILFMLKCKGVLPHTEEKSYKGFDMLELLNTDTEEFFGAHSIIQEEDPSFFDNDFRELFVSMTRTEPEKRATIHKIKMSKWYRGPVYTLEEMRQKLKKILDC